MAPTKGPVYSQPACTVLSNTVISCAAVDRNRPCDKSCPQSASLYGNYDVKLLLFPKQSWKLAFSYAAVHTDGTCTKIPLQSATLYHACSPA